MCALGVSLKGFCRFGELSELGDVAKTCENVRYLRALSPVPNQHQSLQITFVAVGYVANLIYDAKWNGL